MAHILPAGFRSPHELARARSDASILAAFSGGADSSALLHMLAKYSKDVGCKLYAAHVNHCIRGDEADRDEEFCRRVADALGIELFVLRADVPAIAKESGESLETAARNVRYDFFADLMKTHGIPLLATAHNACDNLETVLFCLARGTGLDGLCGIPPTRDTEGGTLVRPILSMSREQILDYCRENGIEYVTDSTNADTEYTRNRIRADITPALLSVNGAAIENASRMCASLREDGDYLRIEAKRFLSENRRGSSIPTKTLTRAHRAISSRALMLLFDEISDGECIEARHVEDMLTLAKRGVPHSRIDLPRGISACIEDGALRLTARADVPQRSGCEPYSLALCEGSNMISQTNCEIVIGNSQKKINIYKNSILLFFAFDKIKGTLIARERRAGDRILEHGVRKSVKKLMCDRKIPLQLRDRLPVICDDEGVVAVPMLAVRDGVWCKADSPSAVGVCFYVY